MKEARVVLGYLALLGIVVVGFATWGALVWIADKHPQQMDALGNFLFDAVYGIIIMVGIACALGVAWLFITVYNHATVIHRGDIVVLRTFKGHYHASALHMEAANPQKVYVSAAKNAPEVVDADQTPQLPAPTIYSFAELLRRGIIQKAVEESKLILGYVDGMLKYGSWLDLYSCAVAGTTGSGKTTTVLFLLFQAILCGAKIIIIDPHLNNPDESLAARLQPLKRAFHAEPIDDTDIDGILTRIQWFKNELARRKKAGKKGRLVIFCIDEFNAVMRKQEIKKELAELLVAIEQEGRKFGIFALLIGQVWTAGQIGGADLRRSLASRIVHRIDEEYAKLLLGTKYGQKCIELEVGNSWFRDTNGGTSKMYTPETYREDGYVVANLLGWNEYNPITDEIEIPTSQDEVIASSLPIPEQSSRETVGNYFRTPGKQQEVDSSRLSLVREMVKQHKSQNEIINTVFPGMRNMDAIAEYRRYLALLVESEAL